MNRKIAPAQVEEVDVIIPELEELVARRLQYQLWSDAQIAQMRRYYGQVPTRDLAKALGKTYSAVADKARRMGLTSLTRGGTPP